MTPVRPAARATGGKKPNVFPVSLEVPADTLTPVGAFLRLRKGGSSKAFLIESVEQGERLSRYSYLGIDPRETLIVRDGALWSERGGNPVRLADSDPFGAIARHLARHRPAAVPGLPPFQGGAVGFVGFDCVRYFEPALESAVARLSRPPSEVEAALPVFGGLIAFDHLKSRVHVISNVFGEEESVEKGRRRAEAGARDLLERIARPSPRGEVLRGVFPLSGPDDGDLPRPEASLGAGRYVEAVKTVRRHIGRGDLFQCVLSDRFELRTRCDPFSIYRALRSINPSPYQFYIELGDETLLGASPEMLARTAGRRVETHPIAGTRPRGRNPVEDRRLERELLASEKERAEHLMLVDLGRNDLGRVCRPGSVRVREFMGVERFSHVMHLTSAVEGRLRSGETGWSALGACFPAGTLSGAPKIRAIQILSELEGTGRGFYGGAVLRCDFSGDLDSCIAIRSLRVRDGVARLQAGAGVVADSRPEGEYREVLHKVQAVRRAIALAEAISGGEPGGARR